jgi:hypothetical protein
VENKSSKRQQRSIIVEAEDTKKQSLQALADRVKVKYLK